MAFFGNGNNGDRPVLRFIGNLREDLRILENSWRNGNLQQERVVNHFNEIMNSMVDVAQSESLEPIETVCLEMKEYFISLKHGNSKIDDSVWTVTGKLMDCMSASIRDESIDWNGLQELQSRWKKGAASPAGKEAKQAESPPKKRKKKKAKKAPAQEENEMNENAQINPQELLIQAQEALQSGNGENAKELALKAAEIIAKIENEEAKKKEKALRAEVEYATHEEAEAEEAYNRAKDELTQQEGDFNSLNERHVQALAAFEEHDGACKGIKEEIDRIETELSALKEKHKQLLEKFNDSIPARDAAEREREKLDADMEDLNSALETAREMATKAERHLEQVRKLKREKEAELEALTEKVTAQ